MYKKIVVAYNESPEAQRAFASAIQLAKSLNAELRTVTVMAELPSYTVYAGVADPALPRILHADRARFYETLEEKSQRGTATGFFELDDMMNGLQNGEMIIVAARPSMGKTAFAMNIIEHVGADEMLDVDLPS